MTLLASDPDVHVDFEVTDTEGGALSWGPVEVQSSVALTASWLGSTVTANGVSTRVLRVPLFGLAQGTHRLLLINPGGNDLDLGNVYLL